MEPVPFAINHQIFMGFTTLTPEEREAVKAAIAPLLDHPERDWPAHGAIRLASPDPLYLLRADPSLRAIVRPTADGRPELVDLFRHERLQYLMRDQVPAGLPPSPVPSAS